MSFPIEDFERVREMDQMYAIERQQQMFTEWQMWENEQERLPARIEILTPIPKKQEHEDYVDGVPL